MFSQGDDMNLVITIQERDAIAQAMQRVVDLSLHATSNAKAMADAMLVDKFTKALASATGIEVRENIERRVNPSFLK